MNQKVPIFLLGCQFLKKHLVCSHIFTSKPFMCYINDGQLVGQFSHQSMDEIIFGHEKLTTLLVCKVLDRSEDMFAAILKNLFFFKAFLTILAG